MSNKIKDETFSKLSFDSYEDENLTMGAVLKTNLSFLLKSSCF
ncbi:hypothetical protein [Enterococcus caccae]|uniref:Uncharacterized protein n=1 Tax=Enterococcus caccae ATCC BAA-1240 TaxID=1158612 RepID=R3WXG4_9ENTE|nr:hypothetical protein [Enterococcus caccae]EOL46450.1 hypothetical protein UC7_01417 [Enterococcus caccae ATCC BAA-1240]EOT60819.1 hypothetical protein I580_01719 [Enterococcus caccae ATCC BAA-1240]